MVEDPGFGFRAESTERDCAGCSSANRKTFMARGSSYAPFIKYNIHREEIFLLAQETCCINKPHQIANQNVIPSCSKMSSVIGAHCSFCRTVLLTVTQASTGQPIAGGTTLCAGEMYSVKVGPKRMHFKCFFAGLCVLLVFCVVGADWRLQPATAKCQKQAALIAAMPCTCNGKAITEKMQFVVVIYTNFVLTQVQQMHVFNARNMNICEKVINLNTLKMPHTFTACTTPVLQTSVAFAGCISRSSEAPLFADSTARKLRGQAL